MPARTPLSPKPFNGFVNIDHASENNKNVDIENPSRANATQPKKRGTKRKSDSENIDVPRTKDNDADKPASKRTKATTGTVTAASTSTKKKASDSKAKEGLTDVSTIHLAGEETQTVPVYATCGDIRRQLTTVLQKPGVSQASFCRTIAAAAQKPVTPRNLSTFHKKKSNGNGRCMAVDGADSPAFYASYVYFEKERVLKGAKKSKHREEMEKAWGPQGMSLVGLKPVWALDSETIRYDKYGRLEIGGRLMEGNVSFHG